ncbi:hypothetical protein TNCV_1519571 [Trichonephila clavipes]|nr:hypothetical protein TNCV_1519571 [Trichonephila clavipes]
MDQSPLSLNHEPRDLLDAGGKIVGLSVLLQISRKQVVKLRRSHCLEIAELAQRWTELPSGLGTKERPVSEITPPQGEAGGRKRRNEDETRVRHEGENGRAQEGGGLTAPTHVRGAPRTQWEGKCCFFFAAGMKKKRVCKRNLQTTQQV